MACKEISDPIHQVIDLDPIGQVITKHPYFQRLNHIKQLGMAYMVYPSGVHTRYTHSLGTYLLAKQMVQELQRTSRDSGVCDISDDEVQAVAIAGLCHDLGHGPFSHLWEAFMNAQDSQGGYHHEAVSLQVFDKIVRDIQDGQIHHPCSEKTAEFFSKNDGANRKLVIQLIWGSSVPPNDKVLGRLKLEKADFAIPPNKNHLFEIVSNGRTGYDVDKFDYMLRDAMHLNLDCAFAVQRQFKLFRVLKDVDSTEGKLVVAMRDKQIGDFIRLLIIRRTNHILAYQHRKTEAFNLLLLDTMKADPETFKELMDIGNIIYTKPDVFCSMNDGHILHLLRDSKKSDCKRLSDRLDRHENYTYITSMLRKFTREDCKRCSPGENKRLVDEQKGIKDHVLKFNEENSSNFAVSFHRFDYGTNTKYPLKNIIYYSKSDEKVAKSFDGSMKILAESMHISPEIVDVVVRLFGKNGTVEKSVADKFLHDFRKMGFTECIE